MNSIIGDRVVSVSSFHVHTAGPGFENEAELFLSFLIFDDHDVSVSSFFYL